jgi:hypothetical protein
MPFRDVNSLFTLAGLFGGIASMFLSAWLGTATALRRFRTERAWTRRYDWYEKVVQSGTALALSLRDLAEGFQLYCDELQRLAGLEQQTRQSQCEIVERIHASHQFGWTRVHDGFEEFGRLISHRHLYARRSANDAVQSWTTRVGDPIRFKAESRLNRPLVREDGAIECSEAEARVELAISTAAELRSVAQSVQWLCGMLSLEARQELFPRSLSEYRYRAELLVAIEQSITRATEPAPLEKRCEWPVIADEVRTSQG